MIDVDAVTDINVGDPCVYYGHSLCAECVVRYVGRIEGKQGSYYGIEFAVPIGMNDGSVDGHSYFNCKPKHGIFVKNYRLKLISDAPPPSGIHSNRIYSDSF
jgi:dynactin complex subunit